MAFAEILFGAVVFSLIYLYLQWLQIQSLWFEQSVPHTTFHNFFGSLTFLQKINPGAWLRQIYDDFRTPYVGIWFFWKPAVVVNSPEIAGNILSKDSSVFRNRFLTCANSDHLGKLNLFTSKEPEWGNARRRLTVAFSTPKLKAMDNFLLSKAKELLQRIRKEQDTHIDTKDLYSDYTIDVIGTSSFGVDCNATLTGSDPMKRITKEFVDSNTLRVWSTYSLYFWPAVANLFRCKFFPTSATDSLRKIIKTSVAERETSNDEDKDLFGALLRIKNNNQNTDPVYLENFVVAQATSFLHSGFDTTGSVLAYTTYELAHYPEIQEKLYRELLAVKEKLGSDNLDSKILSEVTYLNCVIKEALRKYPPIAWLDRTATVHYKIDDQLSIRAGSPVYVNVIGMHYDSDYFPDPDNFVPDRFLPDNESKIVPYSYLPFGEGPRMCIGMRFGMMMIRMALALILLNYKIEKIPGTKRPVDIKIENKGMLYTAGEPLQVKYVPRT